MKIRKLYIYAYSSYPAHDNLTVKDTVIVKSKRTFTKFKLFSN